MQELWCLIRKTHILVPVHLTTMLKGSTTYINPNTCRPGRNAVSHLALRSGFHCMKQWLSSSSRLYIIIIKKPRPTSRLGVIAPREFNPQLAEQVPASFDRWPVDSADYECPHYGLCIALWNISRIQLVAQHCLNWFLIHIHDARSWEYLQTHKKER